MSAQLQAFIKKSRLLLVVSNESPTLCIPNVLHLSEPFSDIECELEGEKCCPNDSP